MNSSILDVDELLRDDSFMPLVEDEVLNTATYYLKQWKERAEELELNGSPALNATVTLGDPDSASDPIPVTNPASHRFGMNPKNVDTRTFTRPKKQQFQSQQRPFLNETMNMSGSHQLSQSPKSSSGINLQIGGLVTTSPGGRGMLPITMTQSSMQKSLIGDTSPPSSICSSTIDLAAERLMASNGGLMMGGPEFGNETYLNGATATGAGEKAASSLNGYNMDDVKREIEMLQNLTFDGLAMGNNNAGNATVLIDRPAPVNETFENGKSFLVNNKTIVHTEPTNAAANGTFDLIGEEGGNCGQTMVIAGGNIEELDEDEENSTFNLTKLVKVEVEADVEGPLSDVKEESVLIEKEDVQLVEEEDIHLEFGRGLDSFIQSTPICKDKAKQNDIFNFSPTGNEHMYRTIEMNMKNNNNAFKVPQLPSRFMDRAATVTPPPNPPTMDTTQEEKEVVDEKAIVATPPQNPMLSNKTMEILNTSMPHEGELQSSPEFEDVPEIRQKEPGVPVDMLRPEERQSLVNFEEYEKSLQLLDDNRNEREFDDMLASINTQDMRRSGEKMRQSLDSIKKRHSLINYERQQEELRRKVNDIDQEINNLTMEGSGSGPRLLNRRSRLFDEQQQQMQENVMNRTMDLNTATTLQVDSNGSGAERRAVPEKRDRDRFKTIKICRKTVNSNIPDADETSIDGQLEGDADDQEPEPEPVRAPPAIQRGLQRPSRILARPKFASGLQRPSHLGITAQKASSADDLLDSRRGEEEDEEEMMGDQRMRREVSQERGQSVQRTNPSRMTTGKLKSPMGVKSKSIHNLMVNGSSSRIGSGFSRMSVQQEMKPFSTNTFKVSKAGQNGGGGGVVASSGYSSATFQRPSTSMTGKSMSSGIGGGVNMRQNKSIGGVQRPVSAILPQSSAVNRRQETMETYNDGRYSPVNIPEPVPVKMEPRTMLAAPRASGLRPPSGIARPTAAGARSGLPRFTSGIPRR